MEQRHIGRSVPRKDARAKVTGSARFVNDLTFNDVIYGATVRSRAARGRIVTIDFDEGIPWQEFTVVRARDIPGGNCIALLIEDQPCLAEQVINHPEEPVVLLAHPDKQLLERARRAVRIKVEPLPAVFTIEDALAAKRVIWGADNIFKAYQVEKGDVESAWGGADCIVEGEYETEAQEQLYLETQGVVARFCPADGVTVWGSLQCPHYVHKSLVRLFGLPKERVRVVQAETGGGFGGKEEYPSMLAAHAALLAWKSGKAVKMIYDRDEDLLATPKRHPSRTRHRTGITRDGHLVAMDIDFTLDGGAYETLSPVVLSRGTIHAAGPYQCPNVRIRSRVVATNTAPQGAFRGFGAPQSVFALERHFDRVAAAAGLSPEEFRRRNFLRQGQTLAVGQVIREPVEMARLLDRALELSGYHEKRRRFQQENAGNARLKRGIGFAAFLHGAGFTGSGEEYLASEVAVSVTREGQVQVLAGSTEIGQGTNTVFAQIAAEALGLGCEQVDVQQPDTARVPNSGPTVASRTTMIVGKLVETAALSVRRSLLASGKLREGYGSGEFRQACRAYIEQCGALQALAKYQQPQGLHWDEAKYQGDAYAAYAWAAYVAEVSVAVDTGEVAVIDFVAVQEVGKAINPAQAVGQIQGGVAQGIGFALREQVVWREGRMVNAQLANYLVPTAADLPQIHVYFEEVPYDRGPGGAKGIGELPLDGTAPAIANAIAHATGADIRRIPITPEALLKAMAGSC